ncbi:MAG: phenylalanine--tRNA ligase subunit beta [Sandaracinaceae bacterium]|nr:phenylalanine--tRNA ligase subunit beta [Sandaracinaceae bacterium]
MLASYNWLRELTGSDLSADEMAEKLTGLGLAVDAVTAFGTGLENVVIAEVRSKAPHPSKDKLTVVEVFDGTDAHTVVCGASNVPEPGGLVVLARVGASLPGGLAIAERALGGVTSRGMLCAEDEIGVGSDHDGIIVLTREDTTAKLGTPVATALSLSDSVFDIALTPNRPDCLGHLGLARELSAVMKSTGVRTTLTESFSIATVQRASGEFDAGGATFGIAIESSERCPRYAGAVVRGVTIERSPFAVRYRLHVLGVRAINNIVDATNLAVFEWGYPTHAFDLDKVRGQHIVVRVAREGETLTTLDGVRRSLQGDDVVICDGEGPVAIAGVMGGQSSEITGATRNVFIECAYFDPRSVRRTARRLGMHTDASHRFERGVDPGAVPSVLHRVAGLITSNAGGTTVKEALDVVAGKLTETKLTLRSSRIDTVLGTKVPLKEVGEILNALGFKTTPTVEGFNVSVPSWRPDVLREVDLIEEVARVRGYDKIPTEVPHVRASATGTANSIRFVRRLREQASAAGLFEAVNYGFVSMTDLSNARVSTDAVRITNPLSEDRSVMRTSLLPGLASALRRALRHQAGHAALFEVAHVFVRNAGAALPDEHVMLGILLGGARPAWLGQAGEYDFFDAKGALASVLAQWRHGVGRDGLTQGAPIVAHLHPKRCANIVLFGSVVGTIGELHPDVVSAMELVGRPIYAEMHVGELRAAIEKGDIAKARALPKFPSATRDLAVVVQEDIMASQVADTIRNASDGLIEDVQVFDVYRGENIPQHHKSLAFHIVYRDSNATLTDEKVDRAHKHVTERVSAQLSASLRS